METQINESKMKKAAELLIGATEEWEQWGSWLCISYRTLIRDD